jgi:hypothetical protein
MFLGFYFVTQQTSEVIEGIASFTENILHYRMYFHHGEALTPPKKLASIFHDRTWQNAKVYVEDLGC